MTFVKVMYTAKAHTTVIGTVAPLNWRAGDDRDGARVRVTARCRGANRALSDERHQRGLRPTGLGQGPLPHRAGRGFRLLVTTEETFTERKKRLH